MPWHHSSPVQVLAGRGAFQQLGKQLGRGAWLLVTTQGAIRRGWAAQIQAQLDASHTLLVCDDISSNPELDHLDGLTQRYRGLGLQGLIALGGGSALDAAKVLSVTLPSPLEMPLGDRLRAGGVQPWAHHLPVVAVPTTSGTGAEATPFATVWDRAAHKKHSVHGPLIYPALALLDPYLTLSLPTQETLHTGLDATSHALESIWNKNSTPVSAALAWQALALIAEAFPFVLHDPDNLDAREAMQQASLLAGMAIAQTRTAIAHSISYPITSHHGVPHGLACSFTLPHLIRVNMKSFAAAHRQVAANILTLLDSLRLDSELRKYTQEDLLLLQNEMHTPERAGNYTGETDIERIIRASTPC